jgi:hypothetical protein
LTFSAVVLVVARRFRVRSAPGRSGNDEDELTRESDVELGGESSSSCCWYEEGRIIIPMGWDGNGLANRTLSGLGATAEEGLLDSTGLCRAMAFVNF